MNIKILVATHKQYWMPEDKVYMPLHVGKEGKQELGYPGDNTGDNISLKNPNYCELTGIYWAWKNLNCDYTGLCHYRRYFSKRMYCIGIKSKRKVIFNGSDYEKLLNKYDVILPKKRKYYIETIRSHFLHNHNPRDLQETERIISEIYPEYSESFKKVMNRTSLHICNMFVMKKEYFDAYSKWLFDILFELEKRIDISSYSSHQARIFGFISERLLDVWLDKQNLKTIEVNTVYLENRNWIKKIFKFFKRKFLGHE